MLDVLMTARAFSGSSQLFYGRAGTLADHGLLTNTMTFWWGCQIDTQLQQTVPKIFQQCPKLY